MTKGENPIYQACLHMLTGARPRAGEAAAAVAHARAAEAAHAARAGELECALREAAAMFKAELAVKAAEMDALHAELG